jgi:hypothetical protein
MKGWQSMQQVSMFTRSGLATRTLPAPEQPIGIGRIRWGRHEQLCTPAYWASQAWMLEMEEPDHYRLGDNLAEEALACLLGGHGIPAEVGMAAYYRLRAVLCDDYDALKDPAVVERLLREPLSVRGKSVRYRFAGQKARYIAAAMSKLEEIDERMEDRALRDALIAIPGIGLKTASWIVRNWRRSDDVSILDVHILRAGGIIGIFRDEWKVERHYLQLEAAYLNFARKIGIRASILDSVMWVSMREIPSAFVKSMLGNGREELVNPVELHRTGGRRQLTLV